LKILIIVLFIVSAQATNDIEKRDEGECSRPKRWNAEKSKCECPKNSKCFPKGGIFDEDTCTWCQPKECEANKVNDKKCNCVCKNPKPDVIPDKKFWNQYTCALECIPTPSPGVMYRRNDTTCAFECIKPKPVDIDEKIQRWNESTCLVECKDPPAVPIPENKFWNITSCSLGCINQTCSSGETFNSQDCSCNCQITCEDLKTMSSTACECVCRQLFPCPSNQRWNNGVCRCECINVPFCNPTNEILNPRTCKCDWLITTSMPNV